MRPHALRSPHSSALAPPRRLPPRAHLLPLRRVAAAAAPSPDDPGKRESEAIKKR
jgi:hypothetical protein